MLLRVTTALAMLAFGLALGGWAASRSGPSTSLAEAQSAVHLAFPNAGHVRDADVVPGYAAEPAGTSIWTDAYDGYGYQGFEFPVGTRPDDDARADQMAQARARLEAAGWRTWGIGPGSDFAAARDGLGLAAQAQSNSLTIVSVGAINPRVWPAAVVTGLLFGVVAWLLVPVVFRRQRAATVVAVTSLVLMLPAATLTLLAAVMFPFSRGLPWPATWGLFLIGNPPLSLLAAFLLVGSGVAGAWSARKESVRKESARKESVRKESARVAATGPTGQSADVSATTNR